MSQILDALRRAEAQRARGRVPGLHESVAAGPLAPAQAGAPRSLRTVLIGAALLLALGALGVVFLLPRAADPRPAAVSGSSEPAADAARAPINGTSMPASAVTGPASVRAAANDVQAPVGLPRQAQLAQSRSETRQAPPRAVVEPNHEPSKAAADATVRPPASAAPVSAASVPAASASAASASTASVPAGASLPTRQQLPPEVQRSLPPFTVSGSVYSSDPAQRILIINGEVWHEGDQVRPGLVLEQIRRRDAVLRFNGVRFTVAP